MNDLLRWAARYGVQRIMWRAPWWVVVLAIALYLVIDQAHAGFLSTTSAATIGNLRWGSDDLVDSTATLILAGDAIFDTTENLDAATRAGDRWLLSTSTDTAIAGVPFRDGDIFRFDGNGFDSFLGEDLFEGSDEDIDAYHVQAGLPLEIANAPSLALVILGLGSLWKVSRNPARQAARIGRKHR